MKIVNIRIPAWGFNLNKFNLRLNGDISTWDYSSSSKYHYCAAPVQYKGNTVGWRVFHEFSDHEGPYDEKYYFSFRVQRLLPALRKEGWTLRDLIK